MEDELIPALRPAVRVLMASDASAEGGNAGLFAGLHRGAAPLKRLAEVAESLGYHLVEGDSFSLGNESAPEVVAFDGHARGALETLSAIRSVKALEGVPILAVCGRGRDESFETLRAQGVDDFLSSDATKAEIQTRLESAAALFRAREDLVNAQAQLARQTRVDDLTGVMSRRFFFQQAHRETGRARRYGHRLSCLMLEIDNFKPLCALFGDATGEGVLRSLATIIGQWTRDSDLIARFADAKFAVLLPETGLDGATSAREKILIALGAHIWKFEGNSLPITVSLGEAELQPGARAGRDVSRGDGEFIGEGDEAGELALSTREALAGLLEDADAALSVSRKGARVPDVFVMHTSAPDPPAPFEVQSEVQLNSNHAGSRADETETGT